MDLCTLYDAIELSLKQSRETTVGIKNNINTPIYSEVKSHKVLYSTTGNSTQSQFAQIHNIRHA